MPRRPRPYPDLTYDLAVLIILWVQLSIGLITLPYSLGHHDASVMLTLSHWRRAS